LSNYLEDSSDFQINNLNLKRYEKKCFEVKDNKKFEVIVPEVISSDFYINEMMKEHSD
jgi:hypothetical protein